MQSTPRGKKIMNQEQHAIHGNLKQLTVYSQNVVGRGSHLTKQLEVEQILIKQKPDVLVGGGKDVHCGLLSCGWSFVRWKQFSESLHLN